MSQARRIELKLQAPPGDIRRYATAIAAGGVVEYADPDEDITDAMTAAKDDDDEDDGNGGDDSAAVDDRGDPPDATGDERTPKGPARSPSDGDAESVPPAGDADVRPRPAASFACPACGHAFAVATVPVDGLLTCPSCAAQFFGAGEQSDEDRAAAEQLQLEYEARANRLGDLHRNKIVIERRHLFRGRTYAVVGAATLFVAALQLLLAVGRNVRTTGRLGPWPAAYLAAAVVALAFVWPCVRRIRALNRELARPMLDEPTVPPDFSTLSDGSQLIDEEVRNLERLGGR